MNQKKPQRLHERLGLSVEEALNRLIAFGQLHHKHKPIDPKHLEAVLNNTEWKEKSNG